MNKLWIKMSKIEWWNKDWHEKIGLIRLVGGNANKKNDSEGERWKWKDV